MSRLMTVAVMTVALLSGGCGDEVAVHAANASVTLCSGSAAKPGTSANVVVTVAGDFEDVEISLSMSGLPSGVSGFFLDDALYYPDETVLTVTASETAPAATSTATIHADDATTTIEVVVTGPCP